MRTFQTMGFVAMLLTTTACASNVTNDQVTTTSAHAKPPPMVAADYRPSAPSVPTLPTRSSTEDVSAIETPAHAVKAAADERFAQTESDSDDIYAEVSIFDPWEGFNRKVHAFNNTADRVLLRPLAVGYKNIVPEPFREGISRFFANLGMPVTVVNQVLQGRSGDAARSLGRFAVNTTGGIVGVYDMASHLGIPQLGSEDFGQTLGTWGWCDTRYLVLPLLGPRTMRDAISMVVDQPLSPIAQLQDRGVSGVLQALEIVDARTRLLPIDQFRRDAFDDYLYVRSAWVQRRTHQIEENLGSDCGESSRF